MAISKHITKIGKLSSIYMLGAIIPKVVGLALLPVFTHYLVPEQFGIVRLSLQITQVMAILLQLGLAASVKSYYFRTEAEQQPQLIRTALIGMVLQAIVFCTALSFAGIWLAKYLLPNMPLSEEKILLLWQMIIWGCLFLSIARLAITTTQVQEHAITATSITLFRFLFQDILGIIAVVWLGWKGFGRQGTVSIAAIATGCLGAKILWTRSKGGFDLKLYKKILKTGLKFVPHSLAGMLALVINMWLLNKIASTAAIGIYAVATQFAQFVQMPLYSFNNAAYPTLAKLITEATEQTKKQHAKLCTLTITGIGALTLFVTLFAPLAILLLTDAKYHDARFILPILAFAWLFQGIYLITANVVFYLGGGLWLATATVSSMIANIILSLILIPKFGSYGAAIAMLGCFIVRAIVVIIVGQAKYPLPWQVRKIIPVLLMFVALALIDLWTATKVSLISSIAIKVVLLATVLPVILLAKTVTFNELIEAKDLVKKKISVLIGS